MAFGCLNQGFHVDLAYEHMDFDSVYGANHMFLVIPDRWQAAHLVTHV